MAVDEHLLEWASEHQSCCWRFYQWAVPTVSLGYFQQYSERNTHEASRECPIVRRASGGGAIVHDRELTYSVVVPSSHRLAKRRQWTYETIHRTLISVLATWEIEASLFGSPKDFEGARPDFLCFNRRTSGDVVIGGVKIAGSAQRRVAGAVLQHGSVLIRRSTAAPELAGIGETTGTEFTPDELAQLWQDQLAEVLGFRWARNQLSSREEAHVARIVEGKYGHFTWTEKRRDEPEERS